MSALPATRVRVEPGDLSDDAPLPCDAIFADAARQPRRVRRRAPGLRRFVGLTAAGTVASAVVVLAGSLVGPVRGTTPPTTWFGLLRPRAATAASSPFTSALLFSAIAALGAVWLLTWRHRVVLAWHARRLWVLAACWAAPFVIGPPLLSNDVFSYAAQGLMSEHGRSPYRSGPAALASSPVVAAVDPRWRHTASPYGPVATALERGATTFGRGAVGGVLLLKLLAVCGVVVVGIALLKLLPAHRRTEGFLLSVANPVVLLQIVSAAHLEGVLCALIVTALYAYQRGRTTTALVASCAAGLIKAPLFMVVAILFISLIHRAAAGERLRTSLRCMGAIALSVATMSAVIPDGWGWLRTLTTPARGYTPAAPAALLSDALTPLLVWTHLVAAATLHTSCRLATAAAGALTVGVIIAKLSHRSPARAAGWSLLVAAAAAPVVYPWYLLWGIVCLATVAGARERRWLVLISLIASTVALPGLNAMGMGWGAGLLCAYLGVQWRSRQHTMPVIDLTTHELAVAAS